MSDRVRELRRRHGLTQEQLAERAELSLGVIKKIEQGGTARIETYHRIARALGVTTVMFVYPQSPEPREQTTDDIVLAEIRAAINPPVGFSGPMLGTADADEVSLDRLDDAVSIVVRGYHANHYDYLAETIPALVRSAHHHVDVLDSGPDRDRALRLRADITGLTGRYLIHIRAHDLALIAMHASLRDAMAIDDRLLAASAVAGQAKAMLRQGRFDEIERLCVTTADQIEPRMSQATPDELCAWGFLMTYASSAASRNNRAAEAREHARMALAAGTRLDREREDLVGHRSFGPVTAALQMPEVEELDDRPDKALELANQVPQGLGDTDSSTWNRHLLTVARAQVRVGDADRSTATLLTVRSDAPEWLRYHQHARDTVREILASRQRMPSREQRDLAEFMAVEGDGR